MNKRQQRLVRSALGGKPGGQQSLRQRARIDAGDTECRVALALHFGLRTSDIVGAVGTSRNVTYRALNRLVELGLVARAGPTDNHALHGAYVPLFVLTPVTPTKGDAE